MSDLLEMYPYILDCLDELSRSVSDSNTLAEAQGLQHYLSSHQFVVALMISEHILGYTKQLSINLQGKEFLFI